MALLSVPDGDPVRRNLDRILTACARARDLVKQILVFGRHRSGDERLPLDVVPLLKESVRFLRASLPTTIEIKPSIEIKSGWVLADPTQVQQVLFNLCTNAAHAMEERGGLLEIGVGDYHMDPERAQFYEGVRPGPHVRLTVRDNGHGMDAATIERIFDPYFTTK